MENQLVLTTSISATTVRKQCRKVYKPKRVPVNEETKNTYKRTLGPFTFTFTEQTTEVDDLAEATAAQTAIKALMDERTPAYDPLADGVFRRWLGQAKSVNIDLSVRIDNKTERIVLVICRSPQLFDFKRLKIRVIHSE